MIQLATNTGVSFLFFVFPQSGTFVTTIVFGSCLILSFGCCEFSAKTFDTLSQKQPVGVA